MSGLSGDDPNEFAWQMYRLLEKYHGTPIGHIQGDECLAGTSPIRGTELCAIVEAMYSCELLASITGDPKWLDLLERLGFNSLPATISADMWTHQYDQQLNQISCSIQQEPPVFGTNSAQANLFGLEPCFGCCTANFNQGWPKLALSAFMRTEKGVLSAALLPSVLETELNGEAVKITLDTEYPFRGALRYAVNCTRPASFELAVRIPSFAAGATVNGETAKPGEIFRIEKEWRDGETVDVALTFEAKLVPAANGMFTLQRGALYFALPLAAQSFAWEYERSGVPRKAPYCDYKIFPQEAWGYAFAGDTFHVIERPVGAYPFSREEPPVQIEADLAQIEWDALPGQPGVCAETPASLVPTALRRRALQPYGCTTLRMTVLPALPVTKV